MGHNSIRTRIEYIDIAKGMLMCFLLFGHIPLFARILNIDDSVRHELHEVIPLYSTFFMQTFFIITGYCSSFSATWKTYFWKTIKTLLIPALLIDIGSYYLFEVIMGNAVSSDYILLWFVSKGPWFIITL